MDNTGCFPSVLLLEQQFDNTTGMGVTLTNLFKDWPTEKIGVMSDHVNPTLCDRIRPCSHYIGITKKLVSRTNKSEGSVSKQRNSFRATIKRAYLRLGMDELRYRPYILAENLREAEHFNPDIIFCGLGNLNRMKLCLKLHELLPNAKIVLYIVDDWINSRVSEKWPSFYWSRCYDKTFRKLLSISSGNLSICEEMSKAYLERYGVNFVPFHNPVDMSFWESLSPQKKYGADTVSLLYVGKINDDTEKCLLDCCKVVESLNQEGRKICFDVYSPDYRVKYDLFDKFSHCSLCPPVPHEAIPELTKSYSALFLTLGFSRRTVQYVKLSMPTKLSEYLASGLPVILYCPESIALYHYVASNECAFTCSERGEAGLRAALCRLFDDEEVSKVVTNALDTVRKHDVNKIRASFLETLSGFCQDKK